MPTALRAFTNLVAVGKSACVDGMMYPRGSRSSGLRSAAQTSLSLSGPPAAIGPGGPIDAPSASMRDGDGVHVSWLPRSIARRPIR